MPMLGGGGGGYLCWGVDTYVGGLIPMLGG